ncbi:2-oxoglutarate receptor 1 Alpha-ketoglutarate receptor 1 G-protein coupled receptor 99 [Larimichthys crocea]|uniref:2-oxoglutarate receptor 1 Alpha-ketoglutarate receptor 1 G-protein coupled receptor 99 n=1 Tax=Larimichthys crocea TaxID=215358 RepID=A0A6G0IJE6_LARCR|nr:P2Y purinoceptor 2 [Larimichthys crocea]KAE8291629.1 2-oxoglutarate receptor 1 Alpha-ketoglutarate receptor 1 G-protein coupled receptor 99 [Larimichthys crocea]
MKPLVVSSQLGNSSNDSGSCLAENQPVSITTLLCLVFFLGFVLNSFSLWVFCCRLPNWSTGTTLQFHLALSDAIATPVTPMMAVYFAMGNDWPFGRFLCQVKIALLSSHFYGSTIFLTLISIHRYTAVVHFNRSSCMKQRSFIRKLCAGVWSLLLIQSLIYAIMLPPTKEGKNSQCLTIHQKNLTNAYFVINFILFIFGFLLPFLVSAVCYTRLASTLTRLNISTAKGLKVKVKSQRMIGMCLLIFGLCFLPLNVVRTVGVVLKKYYPGRCHALTQVETAYYASWILAGVNSCLDPLLYCFGSQNFRDAFQSLRIGQRESPNRSDSEMTANQ